MRFSKSSSPHSTPDPASSLDDKAAPAASPGSAAAGLDAGVRLRLDGYGLGDPLAREVVLEDLTRLVAGLQGPAALVYGPVRRLLDPLHRRGAAADLTRALGAVSTVRASVLHEHVDLPAVVSAGDDPDGAAAACGTDVGPERRAEIDEGYVLLEHPDHLVLHDGVLARVLALRTWPSQVEPDWLRGAAAHTDTIVLHLRPLDRATARSVLRRRLAGLLSTAAVDEQAGRLADPDVEHAARTALDLRDDLARGTTDLIHVQVLLLISGADLTALDRACTAATDALQGWDAQVTTLRFRQRQAWRAVQGGPPLRAPWRLLDARSAAATLPHPQGLPDADRGVLAGVAPGCAPVLLDRFAAHNPNRLVVGTSGAGKSYAAKLEVTRWLAAGGHAVIVDPEGEFSRLGQTLRGLVIEVGEEPSGLDPVSLACRPGLSASEGLAVLATWAAALLQQPLSAVDLAVLDRALEVVRADAHTGRGTRRAGPARRGQAGKAGSATASVADLLSVVTDLCEHPPFLGSTLPAALSPAATGSLAELFARNVALDDELFPPEPHHHHTSDGTDSEDDDAAAEWDDALARGISPYGPRVVVFDLRAVPARARPAVMACVLAWCWTQANTSNATAATPSRHAPLDRGGQGPGHERRLLVIDEAHLLLDDAHAAELLAQFARRARKYSIGLEVVTQRLSDFLTHPTGQAVLANCATKLLLGCEDHERAAIRDGLSLTDAETALLTPGQQGKALLLAPGLRTALQIVAHPAEHQLATTGPRTR